MSTPYGKPLTKCTSLCDGHGNFNGKEIQYESNTISEKELYAEIIAQKNYIENRGIKITHFDRHHHLEVNPIFLKVFLKIVKEFNLPMRCLYGIENPKGVLTPDVWDRAMYSLGSSNNITAEQFKREIDKYRGTNKIVEIHCHPAHFDKYTTETINRVKELQTLIDCKNRGVFDGIELISFENLK